MIYFVFLFDTFHVWLSFFSIAIIFKVYTVTIFRLYLTSLLKQGISAGKLLARDRNRISVCRLSLLTSDSRKYVCVHKLTNCPSQYKMNLNGAHINRSNMVILKK